MARNSCLVWNNFLAPVNSYFCPVASPSAAAFRIKETYNWAVPGPGSLLSVSYKTLKSVAMNERMYAFLLRPRLEMADLPNPRLLL